MEALETIAILAQVPPFIASISFFASAHYVGGICGSTIAASLVEVSLQFVGISALSWLKQFLAGSWFKAAPRPLLPASSQFSASLQILLSLWPLPWLSVGVRAPWCGGVPFPPLLGPRGVPQRRDVNGGYPLHRLTPLSPPLFRLAGV